MVTENKTKQKAKQSKAKQSSIIKQRKKQRQAAKIETNQHHLNPVQHLFTSTYWLKLLSKYSDRFACKRTYLPTCLSRSVWMPVYVLIKQFNLRLQVSWIWILINKGWIGMFFGVKFSAQPKTYQFNPCWSVKTHLSVYLFDSLFACSSAFLLATYLACSLSSRDLVSYFGPFQYRDTCDPKKNVKTSNAHVISCKKIKTHFEGISKL